MEQGPTFPWYEPSRHLSVLLSNCVGCRGDFPLPMGQPPLSPIDLHLQLFLRESAYLSHSSSPRCPVFPRRCAAPSDSQFYFLFRQPQRYPRPFPRKAVQDFPDTEFAVHFIITLDGNKLSKRCARAYDPDVRTRYFACFCDAVHKSCEYAKARLSRGKTSNKIVGG